MAEEMLSHSREFFDRPDDTDDPPPDEERVDRDWREYEDAVDDEEEEDAVDDPELSMPLLPLEELEARRRGASTRGAMGACLASMCLAPFDPLPAGDLASWKL